MNRQRIILIMMSVVLLMGPWSALTYAQFGSIKDAIKRGAEDETKRQVEELTRKGVRCVFNDMECIKGAKKKDQQVVLVDEKGQVLTDNEGQPISDPSKVPGNIPQPAEASGSPNPVPTASSNYDFEPGERALFEEDFSGDNLGDFPQRLKYIKGNMQVVTWQDRFLLQADSKESRFAVQLPETLPEQFTIEFEMYDAYGASGVSIGLIEPKNFGWAWAHDYDEQYFNAGHRQGSGIWAKQGQQISVTPDTRPSEGIVPVRIMVDGAHAKMYIGETRVANVPKGLFGRSDKVYFYFEPVPPDKLAYIANIRIAAGGKDLYDALMTDGRVAVNNIYFDTGSANIRTESKPVLTEIGSMLQQHSELSLLIEGHTDNEGGFDMNMKLSSDRADAVKAHLVGEFGISEERIRTMGLGQTRSVVSNETPEGRQQNRRVELVRM